MVRKVNVTSRGFFLVWIAGLKSNYSNTSNVCAKSVLSKSKFLEFRSS